jgi:hypothetical protein
MYNCLITKTSLMGLVELSKTAFINYSYNQSQVNFD